MLAEKPLTEGVIRKVKNHSPTSYWCRAMRESGIILWKSYGALGGCCAGLAGVSFFLYIVPPCGGTCCWYLNVSSFALLIPCCGVSGTNLCSSTVLCGEGAGGGGGVACWQKAGIVPDKRNIDIMLITTAFLKCFILCPLPFLLRNLLWIPISKPKSPPTICRSYAGSRSQMYGSGKLRWNEGKLKRLPEEGKEGGLKGTYRMQSFSPAILPGLIQRPMAADLNKAPRTPGLQDFLRVMSTGRCTWDHLL